MKRIIAMLLCLTVLLSCFPLLGAAAAEKYEKGDKFMVTSDNGLRLRKSPSTETGKIIRVLPYGTVVTLEGDYGEWAYVKAGSDVGWVFTQYVKEVTTSTTSKTDHAAILARLDELRKKFPDGKYWNHYGSSQKNMDGWTNTPCPSNGGHTSTKWCNGQCDGWARKIGLDLFGLSTYSWEKKYTLDDLCIGDIIRYGNKHTVVVTGYTSSKDTIIISDCNWQCTCNIDWDRSFSLSRYVYGKSFYVLHYPGNTLNKEALSNVGKTTTTKKPTTTTAKPTTTTTTEPMSGSIPGSIDVQRLSGKDRFRTAVAISAKWNASKNVVIAGSESYADALAGAPLAYALNAPILLVDGKELNKYTAEEIKRLGATNAYILGGTATIGEDVEKALTDKGLTVKRIAGSNRYGTAEKIAAEMADRGWVKSKTVFVASGVNYPDALAASSIAAMKGSPILYSPADGALTDSTLECIKAIGFTDGVILGGKAAVGDNAEKALEQAGLKSARCGGSNRYETAVKISEKYSSSLSGKAICFATGSNFPDALAGGVFAAKKQAPVILVDNGAKLDSVKKFIGGTKPEKVYIFGGSSVVPEELVGYCFPQ